MSGVVGSRYADGEYLPDLELTEALLELHAAWQRRALAAPLTDEELIDAVERVVRASRFALGVQP